MDGAYKSNSQFGLNSRRAQPRFGGFVANSKRSPFTQFRGKDGEPRRVSTRPRKAVNEPRADDVVAMCAVGAGMIQRAAEYEDLAKLATVQKK